MRALLLLTILALASPAHADNGVGVLVTGDATVQPQLTAHIESWLKQRGHVVAPGALPYQALTTLIDCFVIEDLKCARKVVEEHAAAPNLVFAKAEIAEATRDITITAYWFERDMEAIAVRRTCEQCTEDKLKATAEELMTSLAGKGRAEVGVITLTSSPPGATVLIDGREVGVTPLTYSVPAGDHAIEVRHADATAARTVTVKTGETAEVALTLEASPRARSRTLPLAVLAGGGALLVGGIALFAIDEDDTGEKYEYRDSAPWGVALGVAGLAAVGAGAYLLLRGEAEAPGARVAFVPGGAIVGWGRSW